MASAARPKARRRVRRSLTVAQTLSLLLTFVLLSGVSGVLTAALAMPIATSLRTVTDKSVSMFEALPTDLSFFALPEQSRLRLPDGTVFATFYDQNRIVVSLDEISQPMRDAVIATEDKRFYDHGAVDPIGMMRALLKNIVTDTTEGASTLTQQYVKNLLITQGIQNQDPGAIAAAQEISPARKLREARLAIMVEQELTQDQILEGYLNIASFGTNLYGVEAAARQYFGIHASELNYLQAATIAGVTQAPSRWDPTRNPEAAQSRRNTVLMLMLEQGYITQEEFDVGVATPLEDTLNYTPTPIGCETAGNAAFFCDYVINVILNSPEFGETKQDRRNLLYTGGLDIYTTLDIRMQDLAMQITAETVPATDESGVATAIAAVQPGTGYILAMGQNRPLDTSPEPEPGHTAVNYAAGQPYSASMGFQPGSSFKPITLAAWIASGHNLMERVNASRQTWTGPVWQASCIGDGGMHSFGTYNPGNVDGSASGMITVMTATERSINTAYIDMTNKLDLCAITDMADRLGFERSDQNPTTPQPSTTLGVEVTSPLSMANAYATIAANGVRCDPIAITRVTDSNGEELEVPSANCVQSVDPQVTSAVSYALSAVVDRLRLNIGIPSAGKTGTAQDNSHSWFVGYTPALSAAVWVGNPAGVIPMQHIRINGTYHSYVYGSTIAAPEWQRFMAAATEGWAPQPFPEPGELQVFGERIPVPNVVGLSVEEATQVMAEAGFAVEVAEEGAFNETIPAGFVATHEPGAGIRVTVNTIISLVLSNGPDPALAPPPPPPPPSPTPTPTPTPAVPTPVTPTPAGPPEHTGPPHNDHHD
jgi:membrane peptidoglycan carboxypeptidase